MTSFEHRQKLIKKINSSPKKAELIKAIKVMQAAKVGRTDKEVEALIKQSELPLGFVLFLLGNYSNLMTLKFN